MSQAFAPTLSDLADSQVRGGSWWASVARALDALDDRLRGETDSAVPAPYAPAVERPDLIPPARRIAVEGVRIRARASRLRAMVRHVAGDGGQAPAVATELSTLARDVERYLRRSRWVVWESANRDLGGE